MSTTPSSSELTEEEKGTVGLGNPPVLANPSETVLSARGLIKTFGKVVGLDGVDLDLFLGESDVQPLIPAMIADLEARHVAVESDGALIIGVFRSGLSLAGVDDQWRVLAIGVLIIVAVSIDQWIRKVKV